ncbi:MAG TPA: tyrosinase family oxidase copper chaperone [Pilimelia sp.]|nr:tyrosinase family oxidase copper chaperone [Pilimelia sp.]
MAVVTAAVGIQSVAVSGSAAAPQRAPAADPRDFDEVHKGKKIKGKHNAGGKHELHINGKKLELSAIETLFVPEDGSAPYVGVGFISALNHYDPVEIDDDRHKEGLKNLAKKVIETLGEFELSDEAARAHHH